MRRTLDAALVVLAHEQGDLWVAAGAVDEIDGLLAYSVNPRGGADIATAVTGDAKVRDHVIRYGDLEVGEVNVRLRDLGIIVRAVVLRSE